MFIYILFLLSQFDFFGIINLNETVAIPGLFKVNDIIFLITLSWAIYRNFSDKVTLHYNFNKLILFVIAYFFIFSSISTSLIVKTTPFVDALKVGRFILVQFSFYFITIYIIRNIEDLKKLWLFFRVCVVLFFVIQITSDLSGTPFLLDTDYLTITPYPIGNYNLFRIYWNILPISLVFLAGIYNIINKNCSIFYISKIEFIISIFLIIHTFGRNYWAANIVGVLLFIFLLNRSKFNIEGDDKRIILRSLAVIFIIGIIIYILSLFEGVNNLLTSLMFNALDELTGNINTGNFTIRIVMIGNIYQVYNSEVIYQILGLGLVHPESFFSNLHGGGKDLQSYEGFYQLNSDFGWPSMLFTFGIVGVVILIFVYFYALIKMYSYARDLFYHEFRSMIILGFVLIIINITIRAWAAQTLLYLEVPFFLALINVFKNIELEYSDSSEIEEEYYEEPPIIPVGD